MFSRLIAAFLLVGLSIPLACGMTILDKDTVWSNTDLTITEKVTVLPNVTLRLEGNEARPISVTFHRGDKFLLHYNASFVVRHAVLEGNVTKQTKYKGSFDRAGVYPMQNANSGYDCIRRLSECRVSKSGRVPCRNGTRGHRAGFHLLQQHRCKIECRKKRGGTSLDTTLAVSLILNAILLCVLWILHRGKQSSAVFGIWKGAAHRIQP